MRASHAVRQVPGEKKRDSKPCEKKKSYKYLKEHNVRFMPSHEPRQAEIGQFDALEGVEKEQVSANIRRKLS